MRFIDGRDQVFGQAPGAAVVADHQLIAVHECACGVSAVGRSLANSDGEPSAIDDNRRHGGGLLEPKIFQTLSDLSSRDFPRRYGGGLSQNHFSFPARSGWRVGSFPLLLIAASGLWVATSRPLQNVFGKLRQGLRQRKNNLHNSAQIAKIITRRGKILYEVA